MTWLLFIRIALLTAAVVALILLWRRLREWAVRRLRYTRAFSETGVFEGLEVTLTETIENPTLIPLFFLDVESNIYRALQLKGQDYPDKTGLQLVISRFHLLPFQQIRRRHTLVCCKRGDYALDTAAVVVNGNAVFFDAPAELLVYPRLTDFDDIPFPVNNLLGDALSVRRLIADPFSLSGIRDYRPGDPFNSINFNATARAADGQLRVNQRDFCSNRLFMLYLNFQPRDEMETVQYESLLEQGLSFAASLIERSLYSGCRIGFAANCPLITGENHLRFPICGGTACFEEILREMARIRIKEGMSFASLMQQDVAGGLCDTEVFVFTVTPTPAVQEQIAAMEQRRNAVHLFVLE